MIVAAAATPAGLTRNSHRTRSIGKNLSPSWRGIKSPRGHPLSRTAADATFTDRAGECALLAGRADKSTFTARTPAKAGGQSYTRRPQKPWTHAFAGIRRQFTQKSYRVPRHPSRRGAAGFRRHRRRPGRGGCSAMRCARRRRRASARSGGGRRGNSGQRCAKSDTYGDAHGDPDRIAALALRETLGASPAIGDAGKVRRSRLPLRYLRAGRW